MEMGDAPQPLFGAEIHGFNTTADLNINKLMEDATTRWLRPNEVHAILSNYTHFKIQPQPHHLPTSGTVLMFDRKMLRNFRKDGHNWKKKKDGKTVQEAHEKLKIGNEERIHVYYARNEDDPNFYRRCYWLLDRELERIVLVHYRLTSEEVANPLPCLPVEPKEAFHAVNSPATPLNSASGSQSEMSGSIIVSDELDSVECYTINDGFSRSTTRGLKPQTRTVGLDELDKLGWGDLMEQPVQIDFSSPSHGCHSGPSQNEEYRLKSSNLEGNFPEEARSFVYSDSVPRNSDFSRLRQHSKFSLQDEVRSAISKNSNGNSQQYDNQMSLLGGNEVGRTFANNILQTEISLESWDCIVGDAPGLLDGLNTQFQSSVTDGTSIVQLTSQTSRQRLAFTINEISPRWAYMGEETKVIIVGCFNESNKQPTGSDIFCLFGNKCFPAEPIQAGVYCVLALLYEPGFVDFHMTMDGQNPISQTINFECRHNSSTLTHSAVTSPTIDSSMHRSYELDALRRLAHLLFSTTNCLPILSSRISPNIMKEAKRFASLSSPTLENDWTNYLAHNYDMELSSSENFNLIELLLKSKLQEWILLKIVEGCKKTPRDTRGQGAIHLCAILDYAWAVRLFAASGFSLDFRDTCGWTALHWAAYYGRERMVAALLSAKANPSLVTDPTPDFPGGCFASDLASIQGFEGLGAYLAEKGLQAHFEAMTLSGNASSPQRQASADPLMLTSENPEKFSEQELCLKESLAAYRNAADAADRIQTAFRERSHKQQMKAAQLEKSVDEAAGIVAALKIQKAYRNYNRRKLMKAAARIQGVFRTWQARRNFLNLRRQVIKIQAVFRGHQVRRQYHKICWSVGILEKAVLRWRLKRKGLRGLQTETDKPSKMDEEENCVEEEFYRASREQAEERVQRSVVRVQAMFRSYRAQQEYRRIKMVHSLAKLEYEFTDMQQ